MTTEINTADPAAGTFTAEFTNIRASLGGAPCRGNKLMPADDVHVAYRQAMEWAASDFFGEVVVGYWPPHAAGPDTAWVPLWHRRGKTLVRTSATPLPAGVEDVIRSIGGAA